MDNIGERKKLDIHLLSDEEYERINEIASYAARDGYNEGLASGVLIGFVCGVIIATLVNIIM